MSIVVQNFVGVNAVLMPCHVAIIVAFSYPAARLVVWRGFVPLAVNGAVRLAGVCLLY